MAPLCQIGAVGARCWLGCERKRFFFEKKNQKTFTRLSQTAPRQSRQSFCFFFQKAALSSLQVASNAARRIRIRIGKDNLAQTSPRRADLVDIRVVTRDVTVVVGDGIEHRETEFVV
jgi:hypothetical protein